MKVSKLVNSIQDVVFTLFIVLNYAGISAGQGTGILLTIINMI